MPAAARQEQDAPAEFWAYRWPRGWCVARSTVPISMSEVTEKRGPDEISIWRCRGLPVFGASDPALLESFMNRTAPESEVF